MISPTRIALSVLAGAGLLAAPEPAAAQAAKPTVAIMYFNNNVFTKDARDYDGLTKGVPDFLVSELDDYDSAVDKFKQMLAAWSAGDVDALDKLNNAEFRDKYPDLFQTLVVKRNQSFTAQIQDLLKGDGVSFVAIGAGHLVGKEGVPALLEKQGYKVTRE